jgi:hypothetical protein
LDSLFLTLYSFKLFPSAAGDLVQELLRIRATSLFPHKSIQAQWLTDGNSGHQKVK